MGTDLLVFALYGALTVALAWVLSGYMHRVYPERAIPGENVKRTS